MKRASFNIAPISLGLILAGCSENHTRAVDELALVEIDFAMASGLETGKGDCVIVEDLGEAEIADLLLMRVGEKQMDKLLVLIDRYGLEDPVGEHGVGEFADPDLQDGSENHLRGFLRELGLLDITHEPAYLSQEAYDAIIGGAHHPDGPGYGASNGNGH